MKQAEEILKQKGVRLTSNRILVANELSRLSHPVSLTELEDYLPTMDKSSIFRVLTLFREHDVVHSLEDGCGTTKYELCTSHDHCTLSDQHVHFYCESCQRTYCLDSVTIPLVPLPPGFSLKSINYMVKGICPHCQ